MHKLTNPPILEAQVSIRLKSNIDLAAVERFSSKIEERLPKKRQRFNFTQKVSLDGKEATSSQVRELAGHQFLSENEKTSLFFHKNTIIFSELGEYESWDKLTAEAFDIFKLFDSEMFESEVVGVSSRFINLFNIMAPFDPYEIFLFFPKLGTDQHACSMNALSMSFNVSSNNGCFANINFFQKGEISDNKVAFILDINATRNVNFKFKNTDQIKSNFKDLRNFKNDLFFNMVSKDFLTKSR